MDFGNILDASDTGGDAGVLELLKHQTPAQLMELERAGSAIYAKNFDTPEGFRRFYLSIFGFDPPPFAIPWTEALYSAHAKNKGLVVEAFRGSTKTTTMTIAFTAFRMGHNPAATNILIQVGDDIAQDNTAAIARIIRNNAYWKVAFPHVTQDEFAGWGAGGYNIKRTDISYNEWITERSVSKDPSLVGVGYRSREIIGKHPTGVLIVDDINDEQNTASSAELRTVQKILTGTIFPTVSPSTWRLFIGTPWTDDDCLHYVASTGEYDHVRTPAFTEEQDELGRIVRHYAWKERWGPEELDRMARLTGVVEFARMFRLDLNQAKQRMFRYQVYPHSQIDYTWIMGGGVDYASSEDAVKLAKGQNDFFAMCYLALKPNGGAVVVDGVLERVTQLQAEYHVLNAQRIFKNWRHSIVETAGRGEDFYATILRNPGLRANKSHPGKASKAQRWKRVLAPLLEAGIISISDAETPFLRELRNELDNAPFLDYDDAIDSLYYAAEVFPELQVRLEFDPEVAYTGPRQQKKPTNPLLALAKW